MFKLQLALTRQKIHAEALVKLHPDEDQCYNVAIICNSCAQSAFNLGKMRIKIQKGLATAGRAQKKKGGGAAVRRPQGVFNNEGV